MAQSVGVVGILPQQHKHGNAGTFHVPPFGENATETEGQVLHAIPPCPHTPARQKGYAVRTPENALNHLYCMMRCNRWGTYVRWLSRTLARNPVPQPVTSWWGPIVLDGNVEQIGIESVRDICLVDIEEAKETDLCVNALPEKLRLTMLQEHVIRGTQEQKARAMGLSRSGYWRRCEQAYVLLLDSFNAVAVGLPLERR